MSGFREVPPVSLPVIHEGEAQTTYELGANHTLLLSGNKVSTFGVVLPNEFPNVGRIRTATSDFWLDQTANIFPNHLVTAGQDELPEELVDPYYQGRVSVAHRVEVLPVRTIVSGYATCPARKGGLRGGQLSAMPSPGGPRQSQRLEEPVVTASTKVPEAHRDITISFAEAAKTIGVEEAERIREASLAIYKLLHTRALKSGIIVADTRLEFGKLPDGQIVLCNQVGTSDFSRFWSADKWIVGRTPPSYDKQPIKDYLNRLAQTGWWNKQPPAPPLDRRVVLSTAARYQRLYELITGRELSKWPGIHVELIS